MAVSETIKNALLIGIGAVAYGAEKSKVIGDYLKEKGRSAVEQGKVMNEELKHSIEQCAREHVTVNVRTDRPLEELISEMSDEQRAELRRRLEELENDNGSGSEGEAEDK